MAADSGVTDIIATPHCNLPGDGPKNYRSAALRTGFSRLRQALEQEGIPLRIHPGAEVFCTPELPELLEPAASFRPWAAGGICWWSSILTSRRSSWSSASAPSGRRGLVPVAPTRSGTMPCSGTPIWSGGV